MSVARRIISQPTLGELIQKGLNNKAVEENHEIVLLREGPVGRTFVGVLGMALVGRHGLAEAKRLVNLVRPFPASERMNKVAALIEVPFALAKRLHAEHAEERKQAENIVQKLRENQYKV